MNTLIIQNPQGQGALRKFTQRSMTLVLWLLLIYLLLPVLKPLLILLGVDLSVINIEERGISSAIFLEVLFLIMTILISFFLWIKYNILLHNRHTKRKNSQITLQQNELAHYFNVNPKELADWHRSAQLTIQLTEQGNVNYVKA